MRVRGRAALAEGRSAGLQFTLEMYMQENPEKMA